MISHQQFRDLRIWGLNSGFRDLKFDLGILIFDSRTKVIIFYFHFSLYDTSYTTSHQLTEVFNGPKLTTEMHIQRDYFVFNTKSGTFVTARCRVRDESDKFTPKL